MARSRLVHLHPRPVILSGVGALLLAGSVVLIDEPRGVEVFDRVGAGPGIPGVTVGDDEGASTAMPVVTSLRSNGEAERRGLRVGDHIDAVDGKRVRNAAQLQRVVASRNARMPVALHVRRGDALWTVAIDRIEPATRGLHDAQDTAG